MMLGMKTVFMKVNKLLSLFFCTRRINILVSIYLRVTISVAKLYRIAISISKLGSDSLEKYNLSFSIQT